MSYPKQATTKRARESYIFCRNQIHEKNPFKFQYTDVKHLYAKLGIQKAKKGAFGFYLSTEFMEVE